MTIFLLMPLFSPALEMANDKSKSSPTPLPISPAIRIETEFRGRALTWRMTNMGSIPLTRVAIPVFRIHEPHAPEGWSARNEGSLFVAEVNDTFDALRPGQTAVMTVTGASSGSKPGIVVADARFRDGTSSRVEGVITYQPENRITLMAIPLTLTAMALATIRRRPRGRRMQTSDT